MRSASALRHQVLEIKRRRNNKKREVKETIDEINSAKTSIASCEESLTDNTFGAGMSSQALLVVNSAKANIKSTYLSTSINPAKTSINEIKKAISDL